MTSPVSGRGPASIAAVVEQPRASVLDRPVWHALGAGQAALNVGTPSLRRIDPAYGPFAAAAPGEEDRLGTLLASAEDTIWLVEPCVLPVPPGLALRREAALLQMVADGALPASDGSGIVPLGAADVDEMTALALATEPGPWAASTWRLGQFHGIRIDGRLAAMAGERMRPGDGFAEVSGVCTWPEFRGMGLARRLIAHVMAGMARRAETPFLHSYAANAGAIRLYESLGFRPRRELTAMVLGRAG